jgi:transcriptional regulator with XRE-family HTH domain
MTETAGNVEHEWPRLIATLGAAVREQRELLGLSQQELAEYAATSQGAISRLESGDHFALPLLTVVKVGLALAATEAQVPASLELRALCAFARDFSSAVDDAPRVLPVAPDFAALLRAYHGLSGARRGAFVQLVLPIAAYMATEQSGERAA